MQIPVSVTVPTDQRGLVERRKEPLTFGVPLPRRAVARDATWSAVAADGREHVVQTRTLDAWPDGSPRWILVDTEVDVPAASAFHLRVRAGAAPESGQPGLLRVVRSGTRVVVHTSAATFTVGSGESVPFVSIETAGTSVLDVERSGLSIADADGQPCAVRIDSVEVEDAGPVRAAVLSAGRAVTASGRSLEVSIRMHFFAGSATVRIEVCIRNAAAAVHAGGFWDLGDPHSVMLSGVSLRLALPTSEGDSSVRCSVERGMPWEQAASPFELYQDSSGGANWMSTNHINRQRRVPLQFQGYRLTSASETRTGLRATPLLTLTNGARTLSVALPAFWENFPAALECDGSTVTVGFLPRQFSDLHEIQPGEQKTFRATLAFGADPVTHEPLEWCRSPAVARVDPNWVMTSGAVPFLEHLEDGHTSLVNAAIEGPTASSSSERPSTNTGGGTSARSTATTRP